MAKLKELTLNIYSNFMKFLISNIFFTILLIVIENIPIMIINDYIFGQEILSNIFSPLYFISPLTYLDMANENLTNECSLIFNSNGTDYVNSLTTFSIVSVATNSTSSGHMEVYFFNKTILTFQTSYCLYSSTIVYFALAAVGIVLILLIILAFLDNRKSKSVFTKIFSTISTNLINLIIRPFSILIFNVLLNKPIMFLYMSSYIQEEYYSNQMAVTFVSIIFCVLFFFSTTFYIKYINNAYYFESFPYDYYSQNDAIWLLYTKIFISIYLNLVKFMGTNKTFYVTLLLGLSYAIRALHSLFDKKFVINSIAFKMFYNFFSLFIPFYVLLKLINVNFTELQIGKVLTLVSELILIVILSVTFKSKFLKYRDKFTFAKDSDFVKESLHFMYYVQNNFQQVHLKNKNKTDDFLDNIIIGHKMKCRLNECILCPEDIYNPDMKTFYLILYQQFLELEKEIKEKEGEICHVVKLIFLKVLDDKKIHRISFNILKISKEVGLETYLKINYLYRDMLDEINKDLKNLITIKYSEAYDDLFKCISDFGEIITYIKSRTEKVEIVINKTNEIGKSYENIIKDLLFLKSNKRIFFDTYNLQQLLVMIKLIFDREIHTELIDSLEQNFADFLENVDSIFEENRLFMVRYDFPNNMWKIKKVPMVFLEFTKFKVSELIEQNVEKIFPHFLGRLIVKRFQELILSSILDNKLSFKTYICDAQKNVLFVKFLIDVVPNLEDNYILLMDCHFHKRNVLIVDEFGNLINGSEELYKKVGINSEAIAASRGKLNLYSVFNVPKNLKLDELKCLNISEQFIQNTAKNVFLVEPENPAIVPKFLSNIMNDENKNKKNEKIYIQVYETIIVNEVKYIVYYFRLDKNSPKPEDKTKTIVKNTIVGALNGLNGTVKKESFTSSIISENMIDNKKSTKKFNKKTLFDPEDESKRDEVNYFDYYNLYYDTNHSASVTINNNKKSVGHSQHSQSMSTSSDLFSFMNFKNTPNKRRSTKYRKFLNWIYFFNFVLVILSLIIIFYMLSFSNFFYNFLSNYRLFNKVRNTVYSGTSLYLSILKTNKSETDFIFNSYIQNNYCNENETNQFDFDYFLKGNIEYFAANILSDFNEFETSTYNFFGSPVYNSEINFQLNSIYFNTVGTYVIRQENLKNMLDLFSLTSYELSNLQNNKIYFNISYLDFDTDNTSVLSTLDKSSLTVDDYNYFQKNINLYQYLFNYFSVYDINFNKISDFFISYCQENLKSLDTQSKALLIGVIALHIVFVLVSFSSIVVYKKILLTEFNTLYSINEDHIINLKNKYKNIKGLIKAEQQPSKIYQELRKLKEIEAVNIEKNKHSKKSADVRNFVSSSSSLSYNKTNSADDRSTIGDSFDPYLKYSGAKAALVRSSTLMVKSKIDKIKKETKQVQASIMLLQRLNFKFELVNKFVFFIAFMCLFYISTGILIVYLLNEKMTEVQTVFQFSDLIYKKSEKIYNYFIAVKLSIILNQISPYTQSNGKYNSTCFDCNMNFFLDYNQISDQIIQMQSDYSYLSSFMDYDLNLNSDVLCSNLYANNNEIFEYLKIKNNPKILTDLNELCERIPILESNVETVFSYIVSVIRGADQLFRAKMDGSQTEERIKILEYGMLDVEIIMSIFVQPYFSYIINTLLVTVMNDAMSQYFTFIIIISVVNLFIDFFMLIYIWMAIYKKIISSVNNIHLVTDSVSTI